MTPSNMTDFFKILKLSLLSSKKHIQNVIKDPSPSQEYSRPPKLQQGVIILQEDLDTFKLDGFFSNLKLNLIIIKGNIQNVIKDPSPSQEPPCHPKLQQGVIILQEGS